MTEDHATGGVDAAETTRVLHADVDDGLFTLGAQVVARVAGETVLAVAVGDDGTGRPMGLDTVLRVYCTIKPVTAVAIARQVEQGKVDLDEPLGDRLAGIEVLADGAITLAHVLHHTAGLHRPMGIELELIATEKRADHLARHRRPAAWPVGTKAGYSEVFGWHLLGLLLEAVTGEPLRAHLRRAVLDPLDLADTWIGMTVDEHETVLGRLGVNVDLRTLHPFPLLLEQGRRMATDVNPGHGGYTTATDLARFYSALLSRLGGGGSDALPGAEVLRQFTSAHGPARFDAVLDRECEYGLGFMTGLGGHAFGPACSPSSFGHSGNTGTSFAFADPEHDLAVGVIYNGLVDHESAFVRRPALVRAIYADVAASGSSSVDDADVGVGGRQARSGWFRRRRG